MYYVLAGALLVTAGVVVWLSSLLGFAGLVIALVLALSGLIAIGLSYWMKNREEHLYDARPRITDIRKPLTPANYTVRSNMDPPFFSFESQNYGKSRARTRIKNVPIDRYLELQQQIDALTQAIAGLSEQLANAKAEITVLDADGQKVEAPTLLVRESAMEPEVAAEPTPDPRPLVDTTLRKTERVTWRTSREAAGSGGVAAGTAHVEPRRGPRPPSVVMETLANTQKHISRLWRRS
jgi:hypothetical protein